MKKKFFYYYGFAPIWILLVTALSGLVIFGGKTAADTFNKSTETNQQTEQQLKNSLLYLNKEKLLGSKIEGSLTGTVLLNDGSYSGYKINKADIEIAPKTNNDTLYKGNAEIEFLSKDIGAGNYPDNKINPFYLKDGTTSDATIVDKMSASLLTKTGENIPIRILTGKVRNGVLTGDFQAQTYSSGYILAGTMDNSGNVSAITILSGGKKLAEGPTFIAPKVLGLFKQLEAEKQSNVLAATDPNPNLSFQEGMPIIENPSKGTFVPPSGTGVVINNIGTGGGAGSPGPPGSQGPPGPQGPAGANGLNGTNGVNGGTGPQGPAGANGTAGSSTWGTITGTLSNQTDLNNALNGKEPAIPAGTISQYWRGDKTFQTLDKNAVGLGNVENTALSTWPGSTNLTTLGTIGTGIWNGSTIGTAKGGTGLTSIGTANQILGVNTGGTGLEYKTIQGLQPGDNPTFNSLSLTSASVQLNFGVSPNTTAISVNLPSTPKIATIPALTADDTFVFLNQNQTLTNKTIAAGSNTITGLTNANLSGSAGITNANLANPSITINTNPGSGLQGGGTVALGGALSLSFVSQGTPGTYGSATQIPVITVDQYGSVTNVTPTTISGLTSANLAANAGITNAQLSNNSINVGAVSGTGISVSGSPVALGGNLTLSGIDATTTVKGVASFNATNFSVSSGGVNTIQNIDTLATPTFGGLTLTNNLSVLGTTNQILLGGANKTTISSVAPSASRIATIPALTADDTFAFLNQSQTFTNKTFAAGSNTISGLTNANLSGSAGITDTNLATITTANKVSGSAVQLGTGGGLVNNTGLSLLTTCSSSQILKWNGSAWACAADNSGGAPAVYTDGGLLSDGTGLSLIRTCADNELLKWTSALGWHCDTDNSGGGTLTVEESDQSVSVSPVIEMEFGPLTTSSDEFIVSDIGSSAVRIRTGNKVVLTDASQTLTNKTIAAGSNTITGLTNANLSGTAGITDTNLATITTANKVSGSAVQLSPNGGLMDNSGLSLINTCSNNQVLAWNSSTSSWGCGARVSVLSNITAATAANTINSGDFAQIWNWSLTTAAKTAFTFGESSASTNGAGSQYILGVSTKPGSTAAPFTVVAQNNTIIDTTPTGGVTIGSLTAGQGITIDGGVGAINIGTNNFSKTISIGSNNGASAINMLVGSGGFSLDGAGNSNYSIGTSTTTGTFTLGGASQVGTANLFTGSGGMNINLGTGAGANNILVGNNTTTTSIQLLTGTGNILTKTANGNGMQFLTNTATDDSIRIAAGLNGGTTSFQGTLTTADLTAARTWTLQDNSGFIPLSTLGNPLFFTTSASTNLTLPTSGTVTALGNSTTGSGSLVLSTSPTFTTSIFTPLVIGGAAANNTLTLTGNNATSANNANLPNIFLKTGDSSAVTAMTILNSGFVGIGTTNPGNILDIVTTSDSPSSTRYSNDTSGSGFSGRKARGTESAPLAVLSGDILANFNARGYTGSGFPTGALTSNAAIHMVAAENFSPTTTGSYMGFYTTPIGTNNRVEWMRLDPSGTLDLFKTTNQLALGTTNTTTISSIAPSAPRIATIPGLTTDDTFAFLNQSQTLTNKTLNSPLLTGISVGVGTTGLFIDGSGNLSKRLFGTLAFDSSTYDNYNNWKLQANGIGTTNILSGNTVNFINGTGISIAQSGSTLTINNTGVLGATNGLSMIGTNVGLGGTLTQNTNIGTSSFGLSFLGLGNVQSLFIDSSGKVGIGTTVPKNLLDVAGGLAFGSYAGVNTAPTNGIIVSGNVGIGTTLGTATLNLGTSSGPVANSYDEATINVGNINSTTQQNLATLNIKNGGTGLLDLELIKGFINFQGTNTFYDDFTERVLNTTNQWTNTVVGGATTCSILTGGLNGIFRMHTGNAASRGCELSTQVVTTLTNGYYQRANNPIFETKVKTDTVTNLRFWSGFTDTQVPVASDTNANTNHAYIGKRAADTTWQCVTDGGAAETFTNTGVTILANTYYRLRVEVKNGSTPETVCTIDDGTTVTKTVVTATQPGTTSPMDLFLESSQSDAVVKNIDVDYVRVWQDDSDPVNNIVSDKQTVIEETPTPTPTPTSSSIDLTILEQLISKGILTIENDRAVFNGKVDFRNQVSFDRDTAGSAVIKKDATQVQIDFEKEYEQIPSVNISMEANNSESSEKLFNENFHFAVINKTSKGFKIIINKKAIEDITFSWTAIESKDAKTFYGEPVLTDTPTSAPTPTIVPTEIPTVIPTAMPSISPTQEIINNEI